MAFYFCTKCKRNVIRAPLVTQIANCSKCSANLLVVPSQPFSHFFFLFSLVFPIVAIYAVFTTEMPLIDRISIPLLALAIPVAFYFLLMFFMATPLTDRQRSEFKAATAARDDASTPSQQSPNDSQPIGWFLLFFLVWIGVYLTIVRPALNSWLSQYIDSYPALLHLVPIIGLPILVAMVAATLFGGKSPGGPKT